MTLVLMLPASAVSARAIDPVADSLSREKIRHYLDSVRTAKCRPTVALVLSGGGAKGAAHVGVIRRMEELNIPVDIVLGTSMGGLVSGLFSMGYNSYEMEEILTDADWGRLITDKMPLEYRSLDEKYFKAMHQITLPFFYDKKQFVLMKTDAYSEEGSSYKPLKFDAQDEMSEEQLLKDNILESLPFGVVKGQNVTNLISSLTAGYQEEMDFMDLPIPYFCVATDLVSFKGKYWFEGSLPTAMRTTMSIPFLFSPVKTEGMVLADGGMRDNYPTALIRELGVDIIIGMELSDPRKTAAEINNVGDLAGQMISLLIADNYERNRDVADIQMKPDLHEYNMLSFSDENIRTIIDRGYATAVAADAELLAVKAKMNGDTLTFNGPKAANLQKKKYRFEEIVISGVSATEAKILRKKLSIKNGDFLDDSDIEDAVNTIYATRAFDNVTYEVYGSHEPFTLDIKCVKGPVSQVGVGARFDTEEVLAVLVDVGFGVRKLKGPKAQITLRLAESPAFKAHTYIDSPHFLTANFDINAQYTNFGRILYYQDYLDHGGQATNNIFRKVQKASLGTWSTNADIYLSGISWRTINLKIGTKIEYFDYLKTDETLYRGNYDHTYNQNGYMNAYVKLTAEKIDDIYFPTKGYSFNAGYAFNYYDFRKKAVNPFHEVTFDGRMVIPMGSRVVMIPSYVARMLFGKEVPFMYSNYVGGSIPGRYFAQQIPFMGINNCASMGNIFMMLKLNTRVMVKKNHYISAIANYGRDCDTFATFGEYCKGGFYGVGLEYSYNAITGPITLNVHYSNITQNPGIYGSIGVLF